MHKSLEVEQYRVKAKASPPLEYIFGQIPFSGWWDTVRYSGIQLDIARYVRIQLDTVRHSGIQWFCCNMARYRSIQGYTGRHKYGEIQAG